MQCLGITKKYSRCKNEARHLYCAQHKMQPLAIASAVFTIIAFWAGLFQDAIKPIYTTFTERNELKQNILVSVDRNRRTSPKWSDNNDHIEDESDIITITLDRTMVKTLEIYHLVKSQRVRDYPATALSTYTPIPTSVQHDVLDLDGDGINEIVLSVRNKIYSLHDDKLLSVAILSPRGDILTHTPIPSQIEWVDASKISPYSAFGFVGVMFDAISQSYHSMSFCNGFKISNRLDGKIISFSWVIDNAGYAETHLHSVESFAFDGRTFKNLDEGQSFYISDSWDDPFSGQQVSALEAVDFLKRNNVPSLEDLIIKYGGSPQKFEDLDEEIKKRIFDDLIKDLNPRD